MGDIAEQLIDQEMFGGRDSLGYPIHRRSGSRKNPFKGIACYLQKRGMIGKNLATADVYIIKYAEKVLGMKLEGKRKRSKYAKAIQKDWQAFKTWVEENYPR